jgi:ATP-dependent DNA helicase RecQ
LQEEIIQSVLDKKDTLALLPTGGGKSLCYQVPALAQEGICLVISPLIALMKDQIQNLSDKGIPALAIYSGMSRRLMVQTLKNAGNDHYKLLYVSPERIETSLFLEYLPALHINLIAVDEAHCISQWGYDFRPSYLRIAELRKELPGVPVLALTASATEAVQKDICEKLEFTSSQVFRQSYSRPNLSYSVFNADSKLSKLIDVVKKVPGSGIVYCKSRKRTSEIASLLQMHGLSAQFYHAGLTNEERSKRQQDWVENKTKTIVCTTAFGMGIDKPDVSYVVHADMPDSLESYYQEAGRAGRDGKRSYAVLLYNNEDVADLSGLHVKRYPSFEQIKAVYNALVNYLQIPVNTGEEVSFPFRFEEFIRHFKLDSITALYSLKALEGDGWIFFNERNFTPSTVCFTTNKRGLFEFQKSHPQHEELLTVLLRTYEGIFDLPVFISELLVSQLLHQKEEEIKSELKTIAAFGIIGYAPQNDAPQIIFRKNRVAAADLLMNLTLYNKRKEAFVQRVEKMIAYTQSNQCRSLFINHYFGDEETAPCGICDHCLQAKAVVLSNEEFNAISSQVLLLLSNKGLTIHQLKEALPGISKQKAWKVIDFLQAEQKIMLDKNGLLKAAAVS